MSFKDVITMVSLASTSAKGVVVSLQRCIGDRDCGDGDIRARRENAFEMPRGHFLGEIVQRIHTPNPEDHVVALLAAYIELVYLSREMKTV